MSISDTNLYLNFSPNVPEAVRLEVTSQISNTIQHIIKTIEEFEKDSKNFAENTFRRIIYKLPPSFDLDLAQKITAFSNSLLKLQSFVYHRNLLLPKLKDFKEGYFPNGDLDSLINQYYESFIHPEVLTLYEKLKKLGVSVF